VWRSNGCNAQFEHAETRAPVPSRIVVKDRNGRSRQKEECLRSLTIIVLSGLALAGTAYAQDDVRKRGREACQSDLDKLCKGKEAQGDGPSLACLKANQGAISDGCRTFLVSVGQLK
jgi:hypothetical protein